LQEDPEKARNKLMIENIIDKRMRTIDFVGIISLGN